MFQKNSIYNDRLRDEANDRRRMVLRLRESKKTLAEVGIIMGGLSRQRIQQIEAKGKELGL